MVHLFTNKETPETDFEILKLVRDAYWEAPGERCKYTSGSLVSAGIKLIRRFKAREHLVPPTLTFTKADYRIMIGKPKFQPSSSLFIPPFHIYYAMSRRSRKWRYDNTCLQPKSQIPPPFPIKLTISLNSRFPSTKNKSQSRKHSTRVSWESQIHYNPPVR